jgi:hypothetical protein
VANSMDSREQRQALIRALPVAALTGALLFGVVRYVLMPMVAQGLTLDQLRWLSQAFETHTALVLFAILALAGILALPVMLVALRTARLGPWRSRE